MTVQEQAYGDLVRVRTDGSDEAEVLRRVRLSADGSAGGIQEGRLQHILFRYPQAPSWATGYLSAS